MYEIKFTEQSRLELPRVSLTVSYLRLLHPLTVTGLPETLSPELPPAQATVSHRK